ncbi:SURF1 family protein [Ostreiculturibacter nitratireducens]|uniref:SURF1 family protein n=1 Tax=Ostreiculturibacter nitratireducens TaxID=3075226 RepID=UPI0031B609E0
MRRILFPLILGLGGIAVLIGLGVWQLQRMEWKAGVLAGINARLSAEPIALADLEAPDPEAMDYQAVDLSGRSTGEEILVLSGKKGVGAGYRVISAFETAEGRRVMLDRGFVPEDARRAERPPVALDVKGNLLWPDDADSFTPPPDMGQRMWFARDVATMSETLDTEPVLVVLREAEGDLQGVEPVPVDTSGIPNDHFGYAMTWFSLALVWAGMTAFLLWRIRARTI